MAFENRNGRTYYYRKKRIGNRVISEYVGGGEVADLIAGLDELKREQKQFETQIEREMRKESEEIDQDLTEIESKINLIIEGFLISKGFYKSKSREWRKQAKWK